MNKVDRIILQLSESLAELKIALKENGTYLPQIETSNDVWFDLAGLCGYLPDRPAKQTVYLWVHKRQIPHYKSGKKLRFLKKDVDAWLKNGRRKTQTEINDET